MRDVFEFFSANLFSNIPVIVYEKLEKLTVNLQIFNCVKFFFYSFKRYNPTSFFEDTITPLKIDIKNAKISLKLLFNFVYGEKSQHTIIITT